MHAVVINVTINDQEVARKALREQVVPGVSSTPGFVAGYWTGKDNTGLAMVLFESEDAAKAASAQVESSMPAGATLQSVEVREVVAQA